MPRGGPNRGQGRKPKPPQEKGILIKAWPPKWLSDLVRDEAQRDNKSLSEIIIEALKQRYGLDK